MKYLLVYIKGCRLKIEEFKSRTAAEKVGDAVLNDGDNYVLALIRGTKLKLKPCWGAGEGAN